MKRSTILSLVVFSLLNSANAQRNTAFAVTGQQKGNTTWNIIREIDLSSGEVVRTLYDPSEKRAVNYAAVNGSSLNGDLLQGSAATGVGVAAMAFDAAHNRLYFTSMHSNSLMYFDPRVENPKVMVNADPAFNTGVKLQEGNVITRMAFASNGVGYAISNNGKNFIRFTTGEKPLITNLGELIDGKNNGAVSIQSQCSSWGGDMVGDAFGGLYLVTYRNHVFRINTETRIADYLGQVQGLPAGFTTNGLVVDNEGSLVVSSALLNDNYYRVNLPTLQATVIKCADKVFNSADMANANLLYQGSKTALLPLREVKGNQAVSIFPNPAFNKSFNLQFDQLPAGRYNMQLIDASGRTVIARSLSVNARGQVERVALPHSYAGGMYWVKLVGSSKKLIYSGKVDIQ